MMDYDGILVHADGSTRELKQLTLQTTVEAFRGFPWRQEAFLADQTGMSPSLSLGVGRKGEGGYMNVIGNQGGTFDVMVETYLRHTVLGFIPRKKSAFRTIDGLTPAAVELCLRKFFEFSKQDLFDWVKNKQAV